MNYISQISSDSLINKVFGTEKYQYKLRIYSSYPQIQIVIFSKTEPKIGFFTIPEVQNLVNLVVEKFELNPNCVVWIQHDFSRREYLSSTDFSLVTFDWYGKEATNPRWRFIHENWYLDWLENANLNLITM